MNQEQLNKLIEKWIQESWQSMYKTMTSNTEVKEMFEYSIKWWPL